jgi:GntR family transcriptional regulator
VTGYRDIADALRAAITRGDYRPGQTIPTLEELQDQYGVGKETVRRAVAVLRTEGLVAPIRRRGTVVRDRTPVRLTVARYRDVLAVPGDLGPWETAAAHQGVPGRTDLISVDQIGADEEVAALLEVQPGTPMVRRLQHMLAGDQVAQIQQTWLPEALVTDTPLASSGKIVGGIYRAMTTLGHPPAAAQETVTSRMPTQEEAETLHLDLGSPLLTVTRVTRNTAGAPLMLTRAVMAGDRVQLVYDQAFPARPTQET